MVLARMAGLLYLVIIVFGISSEAFIRSGLIVPGDAAATAANILTFQGLFRASFAADAGAFRPDQLDALALLFLDLHSHGYDLGLLFFGLSCLVLGRLVVRSVLFPGIFGYGLMAAGAVYLAGSCTRFLFPDLAPAIAPLYIVPLVAELSFALWLLFRGVKACARDAPTAPAD